MIHFWFGYIAGVLSMFALGWVMVFFLLDDEVPETGKEGEK
jgi:hypothetical protein